MYRVIGKKYKSDGSTEVKQVDRTYYVQAKIQYINMTLSGWSEVDLYTFGVTGAMVHQAHWELEEGDDVDVKQE